MLEQNPLETSNRTEIMAYTCKLHNKVNDRLKKKSFDCSQYKEKWGGDEDCGCGSNDSPPSN